MLRRGCTNNICSLTIAKMLQVHLDIDMQLYMYKYTYRKDKYEDSLKLKKCSFQTLCFYKYL